VVNEVNRIAGRIKTSNDAVPFAVTASLYVSPRYSFFMDRTFKVGEQPIRKYFSTCKTEYFRVVGGCTPAWYSAAY